MAGCVLGLKRTKKSGGVVGIVYNRPHAKTKTKCSQAEQASITTAQSAGFFELSHVTVESCNN